ncbi:MAG: hypothetical protein QN120_05070 [Armatimonadota bacterium]|nr:hypothetical protein [Armatimonadota bacterium]
MGLAATHDEVRGERTAVLDRGQHVVVLVGRRGREVLIGGGDP